MNRKTIATEIKFPQKRHSGIKISPFATTYIEKQIKGKDFSLCLCHSVSLTAHSPGLLIEIFNVNFLFKLDLNQFKAF